MLAQVAGTTALQQRWLPGRFRAGLGLGLIAAAATLTGTLILLTHAGADLSGSTIALACLACVPLVAWHAWPLGVLACTTTASSILGAIGVAGSVPPLGATVALYLLAASRDERRPWTRTAGAAVVGLFAMHMAAHQAGARSSSAESLVLGAMVWGTAWFAGERTRLRRAHVEELRRRAQQADRDAERDRQLAAAEERARIARDLHDSAGHAINVIGVQAAAARLLFDRDPVRAQAALLTVEQVARQTAADIDVIVGTLRGRGGQDQADGPGGASAETPPGLVSLDTLLAQHRAAGLHVSLRTTGVSRTLSPSQDQAAFRILQEALTNAARHGVGNAAVLLTFTDAGIDLTVTNPAAALHGDPHRGHGLIGMRERAILLGGTLEAGRVGTTFRVHVHLPGTAADLAHRS